MEQISINSHQGLERKKKKGLQGPTNKTITKASRVVRENGDYGEPHLKGMDENLKQTRKHCASQTKQVCGSALTGKVPDHGFYSRPTPDPQKTPNQNFPHTESIQGLNKFLFCLLFYTLLCKVKIISQNYVPVSKNTFICDCNSEISPCVLSEIVHTDQEKQKQVLGDNKGSKRHIFS